MPLLDNLSYAGNWKPEWGNWQNIPWQQMTPQQQAARVADDNAWKRDQGLLPKAPAPAAPSFDFGAPAPAANLPDLFQPNLFPQSSSSSFSGLDKKSREQIEGVIPDLVARAKDLPATIDKYTQNAAHLYERQTRNALDNQLPGLLEQLSGRRMLNSSVGSDAIAQLGRALVPGYADKSFAAAMDAAKMHAALPTVLAQIASLAKYSKGGAQYQNPLAPYQMLSQFVTAF